MNNAEHDDDADGDDDYDEDVGVDNVDCNIGDDYDSVHQVGLPLDVDCAFL